MKQKDFKKEIFILLKKQNLHQREFARILNTNQTSIRRFLIDLMNENIVDFNEIGKSKQYFIKDSLETNIFEIIVEYYKLQKALKNIKLRRIIKEITEKIEHKKIPFETIIVLFGSYAKNLEHYSSDIDLYVDSSSKKIKKELEEISIKISVKQGELDKENILSKEIIKDHIILNNVSGFLNKIK